MIIIHKDRVLEVLARHIGADNGIHIDDLVREITRYQATVADLPLLGRTTRKIIEELRDGGAHICAHPGQGYYMAASAEELDETCEFLYSRALSSLRKIAAMKRVSVPDLRGQLHLPT